MVRMKRTSMVITDQDTSRFDYNGNKDLLNSQQETVFGEVSSSQVPLFGSQPTAAETTGEPAKTAGSIKKRKGDESAQSASSYAFETTTGEEEQATIRPPGVKASKGFGKKTMPEGKKLTEFQSLWSIRKEDIAAKEKVAKMKLLQSLVGKELPAYEEALKKKLIDELMSN
ncbi:hypothetical protein YC2023_026064 [Brassica napus]